MGFTSYLGPQPAAVFDALEADPTSPYDGVLNHLNSLLDRLEADPGNPRLRSINFRTAGQTHVRCTPVPGLAGWSVYWSLTDPGTDSTGLDISWVGPADPSTWPQLPPGVQDFPS